MLVRLIPLALAGALVLFLPNAADATGRGGMGSAHQWCHWYKQQAMGLGTDAAWARWRQCLRGRYGD